MSFDVKLSVVCLKTEDEKIFQQKKEEKLHNVLEKSTGVTCRGLWTSDVFTI